MPNIQIYIPDEDYSKYIPKKEEVNMKIKEFVHKLLNDA